MEIFIGLLVVLIVSVLIAKDASSRGMNGIGWGLFSFAILIVAVPIYLIVRKPRKNLEPTEFTQKTPISQLINKHRSGGKLWPEDIERLAEQALTEHRICTLLCEQTGNSILHLASQAGNLSAVNKLIHAGSDKSKINSAGKTSLDLAASEPIRQLLSSTS